jgi:hypothetical protein
LNAARSYSLRPTQLNKDKKLCQILAALLRALRAELSPAKAAAPRKPIKTAKPASPQDSKPAKTAVVVVHLTVPTMPVALVTQQMLVASRVIQPTTVLVAPTQPLLAKPVTAAQIAAATGLLAKTSQKAVAANAVAPNNSR